MAALLLAACNREVEPAPSLVVISLDTCRADRLSCYGAERPTPNVDALAAESVLFRNVLANSGLTAPSHLSLFTGQYVHRHGLIMNSGAVRPVYTLASLLREHGWRTAAFTGHGSMQAGSGVELGFETYESWVGEERWPFSRTLAEAIPGALSWLETNASEPFFLFLHGYDPHCPYWPPEKWRKRYADYDGPFDASELCGPAGFLKRIDSGEIRAAEIDYVNDLYDGEIASADEALGSFLDALQARGLLDRSIVVFTSDHGESLGHHAWVGHAQGWDDVLRIPLLVRFPEGRHSAELSDPVQTIDLAPTLLSALGVERPPGMQGIDLLARIRGGDPLFTRRMRVAQSGLIFTVRFDDRLKIIFSGKRQEDRLFNLEKDPLEERDLSRTEGGKEVFERIRRRFLAWRRSTAEEDPRYRNVLDTGVDGRKAEMLRALGYAGEDG